MNTCAVIVTYNRKVLLRECLAGVLGQQHQLDAILVVDNHSTDNTLDLLRDEFPQVRALALPENTGGAGGFYEGIKWAYDHGYDWIWIMDDDAEPKPDALKKLLAAAEVVKAKAGADDVPIALCPLIEGIYSGGVQNWQHMRIDPFFRHCFLDMNNGLESLISIDGNAFVGPMFNRAGIARLGLPRKEYFLWVDDLEYTYRYSQQGYCLLVTDAVILHKDKPGEIAPIKRYYQQRNYTDFILRQAPYYCRDKQGLLMRCLRGLYYRIGISLRVAKSFVAKALRENANMSLRDSFLPLLGIWHGLIGRTGKR